MDKWNTEDKPCCMCKRRGDWAYKGKLYCEKHWQELPSSAPIIEAIEKILDKEVSDG